MLKKLFEKFTKRPVTDEKSSVVGKTKRHQVWEKRCVKGLTEAPAVKTA